MSVARDLSERINVEPETVGEDLAKLVLALIDIVRRLMEKQAIRRIDAGSLSEDEIERMGETFLMLDQKITELKEVFGLDDVDLDLNLGSLERVLVEE
ncbi:MAG TPA: gas vesicle protein K [Thermomicrobiaceae bacterium]|nr:gas vesicle protein K [Thermomicrobiaceae bacterium]